MPFQNKRTEKHQDEPIANAKSVKDSADQKLIKAKIVGKVAVHIEKNDADTRNEESARDQNSALISKISDAIDGLTEQGKFNKKMVRVTIAIAVVTALGLFITGYGIYKSWDTTKIENRPYFSLADVKIFGVKVDSTPTIRFTLTNVGKTPAYKFKIVKFWAAEEYLKSLDTLDQISADTGIILGAGLTHSPTFQFMDQTNRPLVLNSGQFERIKKKQYVLRFYAKIVYEDMFGDPHYYKFGDIYDVDLGTGYFSNTYQGYE